jgi:hypothetical protein
LIIAAIYVVGWPMVVLLPDALLLRYWKREVQNDEGPRFMLVWLTPLVYLGLLFAANWGLGSYCQGQSSAVAAILCGSG